MVVDFFQHLLQGVLIFWQVVDENGTIDLLLLLHGLHVVVFIELLPIVEQSLIKCILLANLVVPSLLTFELWLQKHVVWISTIVSVVEVLVFIFLGHLVTSFLGQQFGFFGELVLIGVEDGFIVASFAFGLVLPHEVLTAQHLTDLRVLLSDLDLHIFKTHASTFITEYHFGIVFAGSLT